MKKTNVLHHSSKNWLVAFVAVCGFMFLDASQVSAQYVDGAQAQSLIQDYRVAREKAARENGQSMANASYRTISDEERTEINREQVAKHFLAVLSGGTSNDVANALASLNARYSSFPIGSSRRISMMSALEDLTRYLQN